MWSFMPSEKRIQETMRLNLKHTQTNIPNRNITNKDLPRNEVASQ